MNFKIVWLCCCWLLLRFICIGGHESVTWGVGGCCAGGQGGKLRGGGRSAQSEGGEWGGGRCGAWREHNLFWRGMLSMQQKQQQQQQRWMMEGVAHGV